MKKQVALKCEIEWNILSLSEWNDLFGTLPYSTLSQSYPYARAYCALHHLNARWGVIKIDGSVAGLVQVFEVSLLNKLFHSVMIDRGPLWCTGYDTPEVFEAFLKALRKIYPMRIGRKMRLIPEVPNDAQYIGILNKFYRQISPEGYQTVLIDLRKDLEELRAGFHSKWRNQLRKAEKSDAVFSFDGTGESFSRFLLNYKMDQHIKSYRNVPPRHVQRYFQMFAEAGGAFLAHIGSPEDPLASALVFIHGNTATWQIGWLSDEGRKICANHLLLYKLMTILKEKDITCFDLGGVNDTDASGIKHFKMGMGGTLVSSAGLYS